MIKIAGKGEGLGAFQLRAVVCDDLVFRRSTVIEFPRNERLQVVPLNVTGAVVGETLVGLSNEFSSVESSEVRTTAVPFPVRFVAPSILISVSNGLGFTFTTLRIRSPVLASLAVTAYKLVRSPTRS